MENREDRLCYLLVAISESFESADATGEQMNVDVMDSND